jgi:hypothetical protein
MSKSIVSKDFYVYAHRKATTGEIFYVGKGYGNRAWSKRRSEYWHNVANKYGLCVEIVASGLQEWYAFELEKELIAFHGRPNLVNMTDGGEGMYGWTPSEKTKIKHKAALYAVQSKPEFREKMRLSHNRPEIKAKVIASLNRPDVKARMIAARRSRVIPIVCVETGQIFSTGDCAERWLRENGKPKASGSAITSACKNKLNHKSAYGYTWKYVVQSNSHQLPLIN